MAQRRHHYEQAFEHLLRSRGIPYVAVNEAKKALLPVSAPLRDGSRALKSFDFVIYGPEGARRSTEPRFNAGALVEIKGRRARGRSGSAGGTARLESWATEEDVRALLAWSRLFGPGFAPALVFVYWLEDQPASALFEETWVFRDRWYAVRTVRADEYATHQRTRSAKWGTVHLSTADFDRLARPLTASSCEVAAGLGASADSGSERGPIHRRRALIGAPEGWSTDADWGRSD